MTSEIYCYGGLDIYRDVLNAIAMVNGHQRFIHSLITIDVIVGAFWASVIMIFGDLLKPFRNWMIPMTIMQTVFLTPTSRVHLIDVVQAGRHAVVDHVPYGLALIAGSLSRISHQVTQKMEAIFTLPNDLRYSQTGGIFAANLLANQNIMTIQDEDFAENMRSFIGQCVLYDVALGHKYTIKTLRHTHNIWGLISSHASPARSFVWKDPHHRGEIVTCQVGVQKFNQLWTEAIDQVACAAGARLYPHKDTRGMPEVGGVGQVNQNQCRAPLAKQEFLRFLPAHYGVMAAMSGHAGDVLKQHMMISALVEGQDHASILAGNASNFAARKAYLQQRSSYETMGQLASETLPIMRSVLELIGYALFLLIMPLLVLPMGYRVLTSWAQTILWLAMWPPMYAILHFIMVSAISMKTRSYMGISNPNGITLASSLGIQNISADMAAMAGYLSLSIPFICIAVVKGLSSFVHLSSSLGSVSQSAATGAAHDAFTGTYQLGNMSLDNHSMGNVQMLSSTYNSTLSTGSTRFQDGHIGMTAGAGGDMVATIDQSHLPVSIHMAQTIARNQRLAAHQEMSMGLTQNQSAERSLATSLEHNAQLADLLSNSQNTQKVFGEMSEQQVGYAMQMTNRAIDKLSKEAHVSQARSAQILSSVGSPQLAKIVTGLSASTAMESNSLSQETLSKAKEIAKDFNFEDHARTAFQASEQLSKTSSDEQVKSLARHQQASLSEAAHHNQSAHKHLENAKRLSKEADYTENNSASVDRNYNDKLIAYIAAHEAPNVGGKIGTKGAIGILLRNDEETQTYLDHFMRDHGPKATFSMSQEQRHLQKDYAGTPLENTLDLDKDNVDRFHGQSTKEIQHDLRAQSQGLEKRVQDTISGTTPFMKGAQEDIIDGDRTKLQKEHARQSSDVGVTTALKGGLRSVKNTLDSPQNFTHERWEDLKEVFKSFYDEKNNKKKVIPSYQDLPQMIKDALQKKTEGDQKIGSTVPVPVSAPVSVREGPIVTKGTPEKTVEEGRQKASLSRSERLKPKHYSTSSPDGSSERLFKDQHPPQEAGSFKGRKVEKNSMKQEQNAHQPLDPLKKIH